MKLIPLIILTMTLTVDVKSNEQFTFPPRFQPPNAGIKLSSDSSIYLPPETHTNIPYFPVNNNNFNLPFPYLPTTVTKVPVLTPTAIPIIVSSTLLPIERDDNDDEEEDKQPPPFQRNNGTDRRYPQIERRNMRAKPVNYQPVDRIDMKLPSGFYNNNAVTHPSITFQKATPRSLIISPEQQRLDAMDQIRAAAAFQGPQYLPAPGAPGVYISSTTETAIPILRLSNEMDLDGSFSYEALGADQTHYVQHSRMENTGTDKEEQVVEGSYSYVGDNGQTYAVHYVADSNGFRASGDHLPVPPPVPEIIQRAVAFNLAEEAKKPPNEKSWQNDEKENESSGSEKRYGFALSPPPRSLFTGRAPESFSFGFAQASQNTQNNYIPAASVQSTIKSNKDFIQDHMKGNGNSGTISPQITFLASQGAHTPSVNTQQSISRVFTTERPMLPQLVNYEADVNESDQETNKALWRWQYGLNANRNQTPEKNTISRSSGDDDVMINFSDMTPEQYTNMMRSQLELNTENSENDQFTQASKNDMNTYQQQYQNTQHDHASFIEAMRPVVSTESHFISKQNQDWYKNVNNIVTNSKTIKSRETTDDTSDSRSKIITQNNYIPASQTVTKSYEYEDISYEPKKIIRTPSPVEADENYNRHPNFEIGTQNNLWSNINQVENIIKASTSEAPPLSTDNNILRFDDFIINESNNKFKPLLVNSQTEVKREEVTTTTTTTESSDDDIIQNNIFLKNFFKSKENEQNEQNRIKDEQKTYYHSKMNIDRKPDKSPKFIRLQAKPPNEIKGVIRKPMDIANILSFISSKNHFESNKVKPKSKYGSNNYQHRAEVRFIPVQHQDNDDDDKESIDHNSSHRTSYYHPGELQGIIKNYKVLQRNNSALSNGQESDLLKRNLTTPAKTQSNLPPLGRAGPSMKSYLPPIYI